MSTPNISPGEMRRNERLLAWQLELARQGLARFGPMAVFVLLLAASWILGGATQKNILFIIVLELISIAGLALVLFVGNASLFPREGRTPTLLFLSFLILVALQLAPLPWNFWASLPGHARAASATGLLDLPKVMHPPSLAPEHTISAVLKFIPAAAVFVIALALPWRLLFGIVQWGAAAAAVFTASLGFAQVIAGNSAQLYLYSWGSVDSASGIFANPNHQATFLLMCLPFIAALTARMRSGQGAGGYTIEAVVSMATVALVLIAGVAMAGSLAGYIFAPFVVAASVVLLPTRLNLNWKYLLGGVALTLAAITLALTSPQLQGVGQGNYFGGERSRSAIHAHTLEAAADFFPIGSGLGTFENVYPFYEQEGDMIDETFVNHAHNDYLEVLLELGVPGCVILLVFLAWLGRETVKIWRRPAESPSFQRTKMAASIAIAIVLVHSLLEFPVRTEAIAVFIAVCLAIIVRKQDPARAPGTAVAIINQ